MTELLNIEEQKEIKTEDVLGKLKTYLYFIDMIVNSSDKGINNPPLQHIGLLVENMTKELESLAPYYSVVKDVREQDVKY